MENTFIANIGDFVKLKNDYRKLEVLQVEFNVFANQNCYYLGNGYYIAEDEIEKVILNENN